MADGGGTLIESSTNEIKNSKKIKSQIGCKFEQVNTVDEDLWMKRDLRTNKRRVRGVISI